MLVNENNVRAIGVNLKTSFHNAYDGLKPAWQNTAMLVPSGGKENSYVWVDAFPQMREWIGEKNIKSLEAHEYTITNKKYEATIRVKRDHIEDDGVGIYGPQAQMAGHSARAYPDRIISNLKNGAFTSLCYDKQYFYDTDHPVGEESVSNKGTAALSTANLAGATGSYGAARQSIMSRTDADGEPLGLVPDTLEVPPALEAVGKILLESDKLGDDSPNPFKGTAKLEVNPRLTSATAWYLHVAGMPIKPFVFQERKKPVFVSMTKMDSEAVFLRGEFLFGVEARGAAGYGMWQLSYGSTGTG